MKGEKLKALEADTAGSVKPELVVGEEWTLSLVIGTGRHIVSILFAE